MTEEGIFRGLYSKVLEKEKYFTKSMIISSLLFGFWHIAAPFRELYDGKIKFNTFFHTINHTNSTYWYHGYSAMLVG